MLSSHETRPENQYHQEQRVKHAKLLFLLDAMGMKMSDLDHIEELSTYLILDGHRTSIANHDENPARGYVEGAIFSMRFARILQELGGKQATFLIHTLRNYKTMDRMHAIFDAIMKIGRKFVQEAVNNDIHLQYFGHEVHDNYAMAKVINIAETATRDCTSFQLNFLTNYSDDWAQSHLEELEDLPEISVIGRFTKGHYSGASIPGHATQANFTYIQQGSVSENWSDEEMIVLILSLLKSHLALKGYVGGKSYQGDERQKIREARELEMWEENITLSDKPIKRIISFSPMGPIVIKF